MKICIFTHTFPRFLGDTATPFMGNLARALGNTGHEVFVLTPFDPLMQVRQKEPFKIITYKYIFPDSLHILGYSRTFSEGKGLNFITYLLSPFLYFFGLIALFKLVKVVKIDVINAHWLIPNGFIAGLIKLIVKTSFVASIPGADVHLAGENRLFKLMARVASTQANHVISDSSHYIKQLNELGIYPKNTSIIRYGVNTETFKPTEKNKALLKELGLSLKDKIVLAVGRMVSQKGYIYLVQAFVEVVSKIPGAKLVIVGEGYEKTRLEQESKKLNIFDKVIFPGTIPYDQLIKYYNIADVFVMPSIKDEEGNMDASPVAMMEAMACGVPVVATQFSGSGDLVIKGKTGYLVKEKNEQEIAMGLIELLKKEDRKKFQNEVREIAINNFSIEQIAKRYINVFQKVSPTSTLKILNNRSFS